MNMPIFVSSRPQDPFHAKLDKPIGQGKLQGSTNSTEKDLTEYKKIAESDGKANIILRNSAYNELHSVSIDSPETLSQLKLGQAAKIGNAVGYIVFIDHDGSDDKK